MTHAQQTSEPAVRSERLPLSGLLALAAAGFITIMLETMPAGILPAISGDLGISESAAGQTVTVFALGSIAGAIPLISATTGWPRRRLLVLALAGYVLTSILTSLSENFTLTLAVRFVAGLFAGTLWALVAGYARRMVAPHQQGKALTLAMAGTPVALAIGTPAGTLIAGLIGWRYTFGVMALLCALVLTWVLTAVPDFPGQARGERTPLTRVFAIPGVVPVVVVTLLYVMAHNVLYTYIASFLAPVGLEDDVSAVLLVFGIASLASIWITGVYIDRHLRLLVISSTTLFALAVLALGLLTTLPAAVFAATALWGLAFGGAASLLQTAVANAAGPAAETVQSVMVTGWNVGIAGGGIVGGLLLGGFGTSSLAWGTLTLLLVALGMTLHGRRHAFPARQG
ncbi:MFS transporter [Streptomyces sp. NPDC057136]|uniref:MFS transporter n=1 Tax=Streptomyces sp. NPDC057136 TaxID=3346029 RepID=UPI0036385076